MPDAPPAPVHALRGLAVMVEAPGSEHARIADALGLVDAPTPAQYSDLFLFQLYPYASVHLGPEGMLGGVARDRVAGFWRAVGLTPPPEPDHLAALIGLYVSLVERADDAVRAGTLRGGGPGEAVGPGEAEGVLAHEAARVLMTEHVAPWVFAWLDRVQELDRGVYSAWAELLAATLRGEVERECAGRGGIALEGGSAEESAAARSSIESQHLRDAPSLPDPRREGTAEFVQGLLAPVRSGVILTRADLASIARTLDLGLRAGERRYALEHLLAQAGPATLGALGDEARRQAAMHAERAPWLGPDASWMADRALATAGLCEDLAVVEAS